MRDNNNVAYIDGANLHLGVHSANWSLDYKRFRIWLKDKFSIMDAYIFLGNIPKYSKLYEHLHESGFKIIFKEVVYDSSGKAKGNCDADLVLKAVQDFYEMNINSVLLVSSDGDYASLVSFLSKAQKLLGVLSPYDRTKCSILLKRTNAKIYYIEDQKKTLQNKKAPDGDKTP